MTVRQLRKAVERKQAVHFWGRKYFITPRLVDQVFGDGKQLIYFASMDHRPNYYVVRVDSGTDVEHDFHEETDAIEDAIVDQFGRAARARDYFPMFPDQPCGTFWGVIPHSDIPWPTARRAASAPPQED